MKKGSKNQWRETQEKKVCLTYDLKLKSRDWSNWLSFYPLSSPDDEESVEEVYKPLANHYNKDRIKIENGYCADQKDVVAVKESY